jgi:two-component system phosphate regulon sensor histidine kinase PhoR
MKKNIKKALDKTPIISIAIDIDRNITYYNNFAKQKFLFIEEGRDINTIIRSTELNNYIDKAFTDHMDYKIEIQPSNFEDWYFIADLVFFPETEDAKKELTIMLTDQTMLYTYEKMRTDFVANVSHELRTPLSSILGYLETIKNDVNLDQATTYKFLDIMETQAWRMTRLVEDLLLLSKYEAGDKPLDFKNVELVRVIEAAIDNLNKKIEDKNLKVNLDDHYNKKIISLNSDSMIQVFINIIDNAIKYCQEGSDINIALKETMLDDNIYVQVQIEDQGEGISSEHLSRLTERFYRIDKNRSRDLGGTGLGLSIVKHIINRHNGKLTIESELEKGSIFTVYLPALN